MTWYAAHVIMWVKFKGKEQTHFPGWENIVLIHAASESEAFAKAEKRGQLDEGDCDGSFRWEGQPASWIFGGVRKLVLCEDPEHVPGDGSEITYTEFEVDSKEALEQVVAGKPVTLRYTDRFRFENGTPPAKKAKRRKAKVR